MLIFASRLLFESSISADFLNPGCYSVIDTSIGLRIVDRVGIAKWLGVFFSFCLAVNCARSETLKGGVQEQVEAVLPQLRQGQVFDQSKLPASTIVDWYRIPAWFAGSTRRYTIEATLPDGKHFTTKSVRTMTRGYQRDNRGGIWEARREPFITVIENEETFDYMLTRSAEPLIVTDKKVVIRYEFACINVLKKNNKIFRTTQDIQVHEFQPGADNTILAYRSSALCYDQNGKFLYKHEPISYTEYMEHPFVPIDEDNRFKYHQDFCKWLKSNGKEALMP